MRTLIKDLCAVIPGSQRVTRGKMSFRDLSLLASEHGAKYVLLVTRWKGGPGKIEFYKPTDGKLKLLPPLIYLRGVRLQREYRIRWRELNIKPQEICMVKPAGEAAIRLAEALSTYLGVQNWVESPDEPVKGRIYVEVLGLQDQALRITFYSAVDDNVVEIGPALKLRHLVWSVEPPGKSKSRDQVQP